MFSYARPALAPILQNTGANYTGGDYASYDAHPGIDYEGQDGATGVYAAAAGMATLKTNANHANGIHVIIDHGEDAGHETWYLHLHSILPELIEQSGSGKTVKVYEGQQLGYVGETGRATGPHLHFGVYKPNKAAGKPVDPYGWKGAPDPDPYEVLNPGFKNEELWRDDPSHPVRVFSVYFAVPPGGYLSPVAIDVGAETYTATVTKGGPWVSIVSGSSGTGQAFLGFNVAQNPGDEREGQITITPSAGGERVLTIVQLRMTDANVHRWDWAAATAPGVPQSPIEISEAIRSEPASIDYETWAAAFDEHENGPLGDIDGDDVKNIVEFALGGNPEDPGSIPMSVIGADSVNVWVDAWLPRFHSGFTVALETSNDLANWNLSGTQPTLVEALSSINYRWLFPHSQAPKFFRLRVTLP